MGAFMASKSRHSGRQTHQGLYTVYKGNVQDKINAGRSIVVVREAGGFVARVQFSAPRI